MEGIRNQLASMNAQVADIGGSVELKRVKDSAGHLTTQEEGEADLKALELQQSIKFAGEELMGKSRQEKIKWSQAKREDGNILYRDKKFTQALDVYVTCLAALDFGGGSSEESKEMVDLVQVPVLCNMAACFLGMRDYSKVEIICSQALDLDQSNFKSLIRRATARVNLDKLNLAKEDIEAAKKCLENNEIIEEKEEMLNRVCKLFNTTEKQKEKDLNSRKQIAKKMFNSQGKIYEDKIDTVEVNSFLPAPISSLFQSLFEFFAKLIFYVWNLLNTRKEKVV